MKRENLIIGTLTLVCAILSGVLVSIADDYSIIATGFISGLACVIIMVFYIAEFVTK